MTIWTGREAALRQVSLLYGDETQPVALRLIQKGRQAITEETALDPSTWAGLLAYQEDGYQVYVRPNRGGWKDAEVTHAPAFFIDADDIPYPLEWHREPSFIVSRSPTRWQAWWRRQPRLKDADPDYVHSQAILGWREMQLRLAAHYETDKMVATEATLMRLAGTLNLKGDTPIPYTLWEADA